MIATRQGANWLFIAPRDGMRVLDRTIRQERLFSTSWQSPTIPAEPIGGSVVDVQARAAFAQLIAALRVSGVFPED
jgi:hypothetical protein